MPVGNRSVLHRRGSFITLRRMCRSQSITFSSVEGVLSVHICMHSSVKTICEAMQGLEVKVWRDYDEFIAELTRKFPHEATGIRKFYDECWKVGSLHHRVPVPCQSLSNSVFWCFCSTLGCLGCLQKPPTLYFRPLLTSKWSPSELIGRTGDATG